MQELRRDLYYAEARASANAKRSYEVVMLEQIDMEAAYTSMPIYAANVCPASLRGAVIIHSVKSARVRTVERYAHQNSPHGKPMAWLKAQPWKG